MKKKSKVEKFEEAKSLIESGLDKLEDLKDELENCCEDLVGTAEAVDQLFRMISDIEMTLSEEIYFPVEIDFRRRKVRTLASLKKAKEKKNERKNLR